MSFFLEFPPTSPLPAAARKPPYVIFGINDDDVFGDLPAEIPLGLVLHYAPKLKQWVLPTPELSLSATRMALTKPYVGINILADIRSEALCEILARMLQHAGLPIDRRLYWVYPAIRLSLAIHHAWLALDLPYAGLANLHTHMASYLTHSPPIMIPEIRALWDTFPTSSLVLHEMGMNFVRSHLAKEYTQPQFSQIRHWYLNTSERCKFFQGLESQFPGFDSIQGELISEMIAKRNADEIKRAKAEKKKNAQAAERRRMERRSQDSIRSVDTVLHDPQESEKGNRYDTGPRKKRTSIGSSSLSEPVDHYSLAEMLEEMALEQTERHANDREKQLKKELEEEPNWWPISEEEALGDNSYKNFGSSEDKTKKAGTLDHDFEDKPLWPIDDEIAMELSSSKKSGPIVDIVKWTMDHLRERELQEKRNNKLAEQSAEFTDEIRKKLPGADVEDAKTENIQKTWILEEDAGNLEENDEELEFLQPVVFEG
jgi:hypothetical protein